MQEYGGLRKYLEVASKVTIILDVLIIYVIHMQGPLRKNVCMHDGVVMQTQ